MAQRRIGKWLHTEYHKEKGVAFGELNFPVASVDMRSYKDLLVWQKSMGLAEYTYHLTSSLPKGEEFGLKSQMRRAAVSIPSNIAEGKSRSHYREFLQFLYVAMGSLAELETQFELAKRLVSWTSRSSTLHKNPAQRLEKC
jgi:four helix bundle protein